MENELIIGKTSVNSYHNVHFTPFKNNLNEVWGSDLKLRGYKPLHIETTKSASPRSIITTPFRGRLFLANVQSCKPTNTSTRPRLTEDSYSSWSMTDKDINPKGTDDVNIHRVCAGCETKLPSHIYADKVDCTFGMNRRHPSDEQGDADCEFSMRNDSVNEKKCKTPLEKLLYKKGMPYAQLKYFMCRFNNAAVCKNIENMNDEYCDARDIVMPDERLLNGSQITVKNNNIEKTLLFQNFESGIFYKWVTETDGFLILSERELNTLTEKERRSLHMHI